MENDYSLVAEDGKIFTNEGAGSSVFTLPNCEVPEDEEERRKFINSYAITATGAPITIEAPGHPNIILEKGQTVEFSRESDNPDWVVEIK